MATTKEVSRRSFLGTAGAATAAWTAASYAQIVGAGERIKIGFLGAGGMALNHLGAIKKLQEPNNVEGVAVADCWKTRADKGAEVVGASQSYSDYRKVLDIQEIDYVTIATPEHWHCQMILDALDAGKAVYCEKPMTHTIEESKDVLKKQAQTKLPIQVGVQGMSDDSYSSAGEAIRKGVLGKVVQAQIEYVRRGGATGPWRRPKEIEPYATKPADLDWNAWLGNAPKIDWDPHHYFEWRVYSAYSGSIATDLFIHRLSRIMRACDLMFPRRVVGMGGIWQWPDGRDTADNFEMICEYPRGMTVYVLGTQSSRVGIDHLIRGYRGTLYFTDTGWVAKNKDGEVLAEHKKTGAEDFHLHHTNLHNHLRSGEPLKCPADFAMAGVAAAVMANESWSTGQMMAWDKENEQMVPAHTLGEQNYFPEAESSEA